MSEEETSASAEEDLDSDFSIQVHQVVPDLQGEVNVVTAKVGDCTSGTCNNAGDTNFVGCK